MTQVTQATRDTHVTRKHVLDKLQEHAQTTAAPQLSESNTVTGDTWTISLPKTRICTLDQLIAHCQIDLAVWEVERFVANKWEVGFIPRATGQSREWSRPSTKPIIEPLFQIKATLRRKTVVVSIRKEIDELRVLARSQARRPIALRKHKPLTGNMLEVNIPDVHFGKLAWEPETGEHYDVKIARDVFREALSVLLARVQSYKFDEVVFVVGNDLLNSDTAEGTTTAGTRVANDGRYHKTFSTTRNTMIEAVEHMRVIAPVRTIMVPGNHDTLSTWHLGDSLECYFHNYKDVTIDNSPRSRKYYRFGKVMLMFTHGDKGKLADYPLLMATEQPEMFGATSYREAHTGHTHMTKLDERHGVRVRVLPALCGADAWHAEHGFVGNQKSAEAYIWNKDEGLVGMAIFSKTDKRREK